MIKTMACNGFLLFFFSVLVMQYFLLMATVQPTYAYNYCNYTANYSSNSAFPENLNTSFSYLYANAQSNGFYNTTAGESPDKVYILYLCRGDISPGLCQICLMEAREAITMICPNQEEAFIMYDECMLRYSNRSIFSVMEKSPDVCFFSHYSINTDPDQFSATLAGLMDDLVMKANSSSNLFATGDVNYTYYSKIYGLVQCTPDITPVDCSTCLHLSVEEMLHSFDGQRGGRVIRPSCNIRYEIYNFYNSRDATPAPSPPAASLPSPPVLPNIRVGEHDITTSQSFEFYLTTIEAATKNFSAKNKIGEGGFGGVYKGTLSNGQEIAVKRLSRSRGQGVEEFKNEVLLLAKLQHKNLVRLLGFCLEGEEAILVYEFMHNKSLDHFLFDPVKQEELNWSRRYKIIRGIARGLLYLHEDSQLKIIHCDLKASNVLLDKDMNSKISDFGLARIFTVDQSLGCTSRIRGTYGYMSPEYAMHGQFSVKTDVFSFGILILEIISGKRNNFTFQSDYAENLLSYAWSQWKEGIPLELLDPTLADCYSRDEVDRCIHIALLCVQEDPDERPTMARVVLMLNTFNITLPRPRSPTFSLPRRTNQSTSKSTQWSVVTGSTNCDSNIIGFEKS
ncbi:cysteine-rich receptor-like protein kinase 44 isoform X2 [Alnus glutinosa]|uniref:cysteine-rich receptor-like protein kinase 44 isoform X2 n=1 Tax=Alnus glutinosa TaxID=3517 RepID=UPI002D773DF5|nr:cysteine-rich receptor-like protein kinase 44 isoform X2 [Alnus glutinosa]